MQNKLWGFLSGYWLTTHPRKYESSCHSSGRLFHISSVAHSSRRLRVYMYIPHGTPKGCYGDTHARGISTYTGCIPTCIPGVRIPVYILKHTIHAVDLAVIRGRRYVRGDSCQKWGWGIWDMLYNRGIQFLKWEKVNFEVIPVKKNDVVEFVRWFLSKYEVVEFGRYV